GSVAVSTRLVDSTVHSVMRGAAGGAVPVSVLSLAEGALKTMALNRLSTAAAGLIVVASLATGASELAWPSDGRRPAAEAGAVQGVGGGVRLRRGGGWGGGGAVRGALSAPGGAGGRGCCWTTGGGG